MRLQTLLYIIVNLPIKQKKFITLLLNKLINRIYKKILATTIVEECKREETGVGLSIALGNHGWKKNKDDLDIIDKIIKKKKKYIKNLFPFKNIE